LVGDLVEAMEYNDVKEISKLTGKNFFGSDCSIHDFNKEYMWDCEYISGENDNFSYNKIGMKPYYNYILFEYEISFPDPSWVFESSPKAQEIINNFSKAYLDSARKSKALIDYFDGVWDFHNTGSSPFIAIIENGEDGSDSFCTYNTPNLKSIMKTVTQTLDSAQDIKLKKTKVTVAYNIFTDEISTDGIFYYAARGFLSAQEIVLKLDDRVSERYWESYDDKYIYLSNGENEICCEFYGDDLVWLSNTSGDDFTIEERNIYFIRNNIKKDEVIESLEKEGFSLKDNKNGG
jgi:hypothetical protein